MKEYLKNNCYLTLHEVELSKQILHKKKVCGELLPLKTWIFSFLQDKETELNHILYLLDLNDEDTFRNVFKQVQTITRDLVYCNTRLISSIHRYQETDNVCLRMLSWLHAQHPIVKGLPLGISDGNFMIAASDNLPTIYYLPNSSQHILLHLPLFFHEIGHKFFVHHRLEMMDLVKEFQIRMLKFFKSAYQKNDKRTATLVKKTKIIVVDTWTKWIEELFCDAVGVRIGGASYLHAFSHYLRMNGRAAFYRTDKDLGGSSHPVPWLRVKFLVKWAEDFGLREEAEALSTEWNALAKMQEIREQYFGFYRDDFYNDVKQCLDDMLIESEPILFQDYDSNIRNFDPSKNNFIELANLAWRKFHDDLVDYEEWEKSVVSSFTSNL